MNIDSHTGGKTSIGKNQWYKSQTLKIYNFKSSHLLQISTAFKRSILRTDYNFFVAFIIKVI